MNFPRVSRIEKASIRRLHRFKQGQEAGAVLNERNYHDGLFLR
jgi:hypothetical protein